jgi:hypothetical protein
MKQDAGGVRRCLLVHGESTTSQLAYVRKRNSGALAVALRAAPSFDIRYLIWEVFPVGWRRDRQP